MLNANYISKKKKKKDDGLKCKTIKSTGRKYLQTIHTI